MNITRENYETFIVDYLDGKLDPIQSANLIHFLSQNPDLEEEFNEYENIKVNPTKNINPDKQILKKDYSDVKNINNDNFDEFCIARFEGDLKRCDELRLKEYLKEHPEKLRDFILYSKLYLIPDYSIKYSKKYNIKKKSPFVHTKRLILYSSSIAAAVLILIMLVFRPGKNIEEMSKIQVINNVTEKQIISQEDYLNNLSFNEMLTRKEDNLHLRENTMNNKIEEKVHYKQQYNITADNRETLEYLIPIYPKIINTVENSDIIMCTMIKTEDNLNENKYIPEELTAQNLKEKYYHRYFGINLNKINVWTLAEAGIKSYNYLTESEVLLSKKVSNEGKVTAFALNSESFSISSILKK